VSHFIRIVSYSSLREAFWPCSSHTHRCKTHTSCSCKCAEYEDGEYHLK